MLSCSSAATRAARRTPDTAIANATAVGLGSVAAQEPVAISGTVHCRPLSTPVGVRRTSCGSFLGRGATSHVFDILRLVVVCAAAVAVVVVVMV